MDEYVNEIYWDLNNGAIYGSGSQVNYAGNYHVQFKNELMSPGETIVNWTSTTDYQGARDVPKLPLLYPNHHYRMVVKARPDQPATMSTRLTFRNIQGEQLKQIEFNNDNRRFMVPQDIENYQLELINAGCKTLDFSRIEICPEKMSRDANQSIWFHTVLHAPAADDPIYVLLITDQKYYRREYGTLQDRYPQLSLLPVSVNWQDFPNVVDQLPDQVHQYLLHNHWMNAHIVSCDPKMDEVVDKLLYEEPLFDGLITDQSDNEYLDQYIWPDVQWWLSRDAVTPDWPTIFNAIEQKWGI